MSTFLSHAAKHHLITSMKEYPHLWDVRHADYNKADLKRDAWNIVHAKMTQFGCTLTHNELRVAWKSLRDVHRRMVKNESMGKHRPRPWPFMEPMDYLVAAINKDSYHCHHIDVSTASLDELRKLEEEGGASTEAISNRLLEMVQTSLRNMEDPIKEEVSDEFVDSPASVSHGLNGSHVPAGQRETTSGEQTAAPRKLITTENMTEGIEVLRQMLDKLRSKVTPDKFDNFGAYVASSLRDMDSDAAKIMMKSINDKLLDSSE